MNQFFHPNWRPGDEPPSRRVYAAMEVPDADEEAAKRGSAQAELPSEPLYLECIDADWVDAHRASPESVRFTRFAEAPLTVLEILPHAAPQLPADAAAGEVSWFEIRYTARRSGDVDGSVYRNLFTGGQPVQIERQRSMAPKWSPLPSWSSVNSGRQVAQATQTTARDVLSDIDSRGGVAVYDVGQGACQAVLDEGLVPSLYVDFGGGVLGNASTFPHGHRGFCFTKHPALILSHWDWDHWSSAYRFPTALHATWIAPPVPDKPIQRAFATDLLLHDNLRIWTTSMAGRLRVGPITIERCTGRTANDSGLSVTVHASDHPRAKCLLPGDASYRFIPTVSHGRRFDAISITHHGGRLHSSVIPTPKGAAKTACSVGAGNSYSHPFLDTLDAHARAGWPLPATTGTAAPRPSHVLLPWDTPPRLFAGRCHRKPRMCSTAA